MPSLSTKLMGKVSLEKILLVLIVAIAFFFRVYKLPSELFLMETHNIFFGLRLHILDWFNFGDHASLNFFKSLLLSTSLRYPLGNYISTTIYSWMNIPITQFWILFFYVCFGTLCVIGTYVLGRQLSDYRVSLIGAVLLAVNFEQIHFYSRSEGATVLVTFFVMTCFITLFHFKNHRTWVWRTVISLILAFLASDSSLSILPLVIIYQIILFVPSESSYSKKILGIFRYLVSKENILLWLPCFFILLIHLYAYTRLGESQVGFFGHIALNMAVKVPATFLETVVTVLGKYSSYYFNPELFYSSLAVFIFLVIRWKDNKLNQAFIFLGVGFFYTFILILVTGSTKIIYLNDPINILFFAAVWVALFDFIVRKFDNAKWAPITSFVLYAGLSVFVISQVVGAYQEVIKRHRVVHPLKSMGYYIHEHGGGNPTVYLMKGCLGRIYHNAEFYFGTQVIDMGEQYGLPRKLFCIGSKSIEETLADYKMEDFDFFATVYNYTASSYFRHVVEQSHFNLRTPELDSKIQELISKGAKRVAAIKNGEVLLGEIYSRRNLPFIDMEIDEYDPLWEQKYANIPSIVKTVWTGQATLWGYIFDPVTGTKRK
jgi:hypothetical protein